MWGRSKALKCAGCSFCFLMMTMRKINVWYNVMKIYLLLKPDISCPFVQHIWPRQCSNCVFWFCVHPVYARTGNQAWTCNSVALMWSNHQHCSFSSRAHGAQQACEKTLQEPGSKSSAYSYSSRSRLQCGLGISKKCLFVRPSSLEMCCPKGHKGFSYLDTRRKNMSEREVAFNTCWYQNRFHGECVKG